MYIGNEEMKFRNKRKLRPEANRKKNHSLLHERFE